MDVESPHHLERLRDLKSIKVALLLLGASSQNQQARFEHSSRNPDYWPAVEALRAQIVAAGAPVETCTPITVYGRPCWLICTLNAPRADSPFSIAVAAAESEKLEAIVARLRSVCHDYWYGLYFFK